MTTIGQSIRGPAQCNTSEAMRGGTGDVYQGEWKDQMRHGKGRIEYSSKDVFIGLWECNKRSDGEGTMHYDNGDSYQGQFKDKKCDGFGM